MAITRAKSVILPLAPLDEEAPTPVPVPEAEAEASGPWCSLSCVSMNSSNATPVRLRFLQLSIYTILYEFGRENRRTLFHA